MLRNKRGWIGLLVTLFFLALFMRQVEFDRIGESFSAANYLWLIPAVPVYFAGVWFRAVRWRHLLAPLGSFSGPGLFPYVVIGYTVNDILPLRIGELVRAYLVGERWGIAKTPVLATAILERIFDGLTLLGFMAVIALFIPLEGWLGQIFKGMTLVFLGALAGLFVALIFQEQSMRLLAILLQRLPEHLRGLALRLAGGFLSGLLALRSPQRVAAVAFYSILAWICEAGVFYCVGLALGLVSPPFVYFLSMAAGNLATALPSSQAGIGPFEYFTAQTFVAFGTASSMAAVFAVLVHAVLIVPVVLLGLVFLWFEQLSLGQVVRNASLETSASGDDFQKDPAQE